jgi:hypothetical protein
MDKLNIFILLIGALGFVALLCISNPATATPTLLDDDGLKAWGDLLLSYNTTLAELPANATEFIRAYEGAV